MNTQQLHVCQGHWSSSVVCIIHDNQHFIKNYLVITCVFGFLFQNRGCKYIKPVLHLQDMCSNAIWHEYSRNIRNFFVREKFQSSLSFTEGILNSTFAVRSHRFFSTHTNVNRSQTASLLILYITDALLEIFEGH